MKTCRAAVVLLWMILASAAARAQFPPAPGTGPGLAETIEAIDNARVTTRILYITAHPDDESAAVLTYLARGLHADVALLSLTRGEGGQNALGPEQAPQLGLIRTQELLAATRGYGVKLYFTRAKDFGFSKTPEETERIWGDQVLEDMVRVIRTFRPNVVINHWGGVHGGHGHHQAAGLLTPKAVAMAADEKVFPDQITEGLTAWGGAKNEVPILDLDRFSDKLTGHVLPLDDVSPLWGKTWREMGMDAFANHRTQGVAVFFGNSFFQRPIALKREDGKPLDPQILAKSLDQLADAQSPAGCSDAGACNKAIKDADASLVAARAAALELNWIQVSQFLSRAQRQIADLYPADVSPPRIKLKEALQKELRNERERIAKAAQLADGMEVNALADTSTVVLREHFGIKVTHRCREGVDCVAPGFFLYPRDVKIDKKEESNGVRNFTAEFTGYVHDSSPLEKLKPELGSLLEVLQNTGGDLEANTALFDGYPVEHIATTSTHVEKVPLRIVPAYTLAVEPKQAIETLASQRRPFDVFLRVHSYSTRTAEIAVGLEVPPGWKSSDPVKLNFEGQGDQYAKLTVTPPESIQPGRFALTAYVERGEEKFTTSLEPLPSMPTLLWEEPAQCLVHTFDINVPKNLKVGYITAESEPVPDSLRMLGIQVDLLDAAALNFGDLSKYDAIVVGVRAYELRSELPGANQRLLDYVSNGGTLVVQYERDFAWDGKNYAPYPAKIDGGQAGQPLPRITDETAAVNLLKPDNPLLNKPNKITSKDFDGWVQERGLYFWTDFDTTKYTALLSMHDPGEKDLNGALVYTKVGKGTYIYTGLAFFRQLPEGIPGAYRLFVNLLSASRSQ